MRSEKLLTWLTPLLLLVPALARAAEATLDRAAAARGEITYVRYCVSCHGKTARGDGPLADDLRVPVPDLTTMAARNGGEYPHARVVRIIESGEVVRGHGTADMPAWGDAFKKTTGTNAPNVATAIRNLTHYIWSLQQPLPK